MSGDAVSDMYIGNTGEFFTQSGQWTLRAHFSQIPLAQVLNVKHGK